MLKQRLLSAFIIIMGISLLILFLNNQYLTYLVALISSISLWEFLKVRFTNVVSLLGIFLFLILMFVSFSPFFSYLFITLSVITYFLSSILILSFPLNKTFLKRPIVWSLSGFVIHLGFSASLIQIISNNNLQLTFLDIDSGKFLIFYIVLIAVCIHGFNLCFTRSMDLTNEVTFPVIIISLSAIVIYLVSSLFFKKSFI